MVFQEIFHSVSTHQLLKVPREVGKTQFSLDVYPITFNFGYLQSIKTEKWQETRL